MDTGQSISFTSLRRITDRLFNHSVHLSSLVRASSKKGAFIATGSKLSKHHRDVLFLLFRCFLTRIAPLSVRLRCEWRVAARLSLSSG